MRRVVRRYRAKRPVRRRVARRRVVRRKKPVRRVRRRRSMGSRILYPQFLREIHFTPMSPYHRLGPSGPPVNVTDNGMDVEGLPNPLNASGINNVAMRSGKELFAAEQQLKRLRSEAGIATE